MPQPKNGLCCTGTKERWVLVVPLLFSPPPGLTQQLGKARRLPGGAPLTDAELCYTKAANWPWVFRYAAHQLWLHGQLPLRFLFKHQLLLLSYLGEIFPLFHGKKPGGIRAG